MIRVSFDESDLSYVETLFPGGLEVAREDYRFGTVDFHFHESDASLVEELERACGRHNIIMKREDE